MADVIACIIAGAFVLVLAGVALVHVAYGIRCIQETKEEKHETD